MPVLDLRIGLGHVLTIISLLLAVGGAWVDLSNNQHETTAEVKRILDHMEVVDTSREEFRASIERLNTKVSNIENSLVMVMKDHDEIIQLKAAIDIVIGQLGDRKNGG